MSAEDNLRFIFIFLFFISSISYADIKTFDLKNLSEIANGQDYTVLVFWATYCPFCKKELKDINSEYHKFTEKNVRVIALSTDLIKSTVENFLKTANYKFETYIASEDIKKQFNIHYIPVTVIIDKNGDLHDITPGRKSVKDIFEMMQD
ncbi:MAG: alkyl hydroperoxide reductase/Thiol specific antioxidant/Mal allergen [Deferribacteraceae bacterium]|nr:alkyl hydroperoxide reductase/Thiol specific antioxidant/Mal allergen [Deferribacteraceae bacterium]